LVLAIVVTLCSSTIALSQTDALFIDAHGRVGIGAIAPDGSYVVDAEITHTVLDVRDQFGNTIPHSHSVRAPVGSPAPDSFFDIFVELAPGGNWQVDSFFDITYRIAIQGVPGGPPVVLQMPSGQFSPDGFFDITYTIDAASTGFNKHYDVKPRKAGFAEGLQLLDLNISSNDWAVDSFFDITYRIGALADPPLLDLSEPTIGIRLTGLVVPEPSALWLGVLALAETWARRRKRNVP
jgi:hypothetical protein